MTRIVVETDKNGNFIPTNVVRAVAGEVAQLASRISEDLLMTAANFAPIKEGHLRASGNVRYLGKQIFQLQKSPTKGGKSVPKVSGSKKFDLDALSSMSSSSPDPTRLVFSVGFGMPYSLVRHEGTYKLGKISKQANSAGKYAGKVGRKYLTRALSERLPRYKEAVKAFGKKSFGSSSSTMTVKR